MEDVEFVYTLSDPKAAIMSVDIEDKDEERTATSYGANPNTQVVWYDTTGGDVYQHYGQLTMKVTYTVSGAEGGEDAVTRTIEPMWDPVQGGLLLLCDEEDAALVKASDPNNQTTWLWIWDEGANNLNRTLQA
ncbi:MAG: hypothetical protein ACLSFZ_12425 [Frisingicoccus sp.]